VNPHLHPLADTQLVTPFLQADETFHRANVVDRSRLVQDFSLRPEPFSHPQDLSGPGRTSCDLIPHDGPLSRADSVHEFLLDLNPDDPRTIGTEQHKGFPPGTADHLSEVGQQSQHRPCSRGPDGQVVQLRFGLAHSSGQTAAFQLRLPHFPGGLPQLQLSQHPLFLLHQGLKLHDLEARRVQFLLADQPAIERAAFAVPGLLGRAETLLGGLDCRRLLRPTLLMDVRLLAGQLPGAQLEAGAVGRGAGEVVASGLQALAPQAQAH